MAPWQNLRLTSCDDWYVIYHVIISFFNRMTTATIHRSKINFRRLVTDLVGMYSEDIFDVVLSELVANSLDAKATLIEIRWDPSDRKLSVKDNGTGMSERQFAEYHDFAVELKRRGSGIGFAGLGAKLSFDFADKVLTSTRRGTVERGSMWFWDEEGGLSWTSTDSPRLDGEGTTVEISLNEKYDTSRIDRDRIVQSLKRSYLPLFLEDFLDVYAAVGIYSNDLRFQVDGLTLEPDHSERALSFSNQSKFEVKRGRKSLGIGAIGVVDGDDNRLEIPYGVLLCTYGKAVKSELFGLPTGKLGNSLFGIYEIPDLSDFLTTNKSDFKDKPGRSRPLGKILDLVKDQLRGYLEDQGVTLSDRKRGALSARIERELRSIVDQLPELRDFGTNRLREQTLREDELGDIKASLADGNANSSENEGESGTKSGSGDGATSQEPAYEATQDGATPTRQRRARRSRGPQVAFEDLPSRPEISWVDGDVITINSGHSAYSNRISGDPARLTYCMFAIAVAIDKAGLADPVEGMSYVDTFLSAWGNP